MRGDSSRGFMRVASPPVQTWGIDDAGSFSRGGARSKLVVHANHDEVSQQGGPGEWLGEKIGGLAVRGDHGRHDGGSDFLAGTVPAYCEVLAGCLDDFGCGPRKARGGVLVDGCGLGLRKVRLRKEVPELQYGVGALVQSDVLGGTGRAGGERLEL